MKRIPLVKSVMTPFPHSIDVDDTVEKAATMMIDHGIRHLPVTDGGKPLGILTDRDIRRALAQHPGTAGAEVPLSGTASASPRVRQIANLDGYIVDLRAPLDSVILDMARQHLTTALVVQDERLVGILTASDAFRYLGKLLGALFPRGRGDAA